MGEDKARLELAGRSLLERAIACLEPVSDRVLLACGAEPRYAWTGCDVVIDSFPGGGPLVGLEAALAALVDTDAEWVAVLACDMPRVEAQVFAELLREAHTRELDVCMLASERGPEPLCAVYHRRCLAPLRAALARGERRVTGFHDEPVVEEGPRTARRLAVGTMTASEDVVLNLNTPADLELERGLAGGES